MQTKTSLKRKLSLGVSGVAISSVLFTAMVVTGIYWQKFWQLHSQRQQYFTSYTASEISSWFEDHFRKLLFVSQIQDLVNQAPAYQQNLLNSIVESNSAIEDIAIIDPDMKIVGSQNRAFASDYDYVVDSLQVQSVLRQGNEYVDICNTKSDPHNYYLAVIYPLRASNGNINGVVRTIIDLDYLNHLIANLNFGRNGYAFIINPQNKIVADNLSGLSCDNAKRSLTRDYLQLLRAEEKVGIYSGFCGKMVSGYHIRLGGVNWFLVVELPVFEILQNMSRVLWLLALVAVFALFLATLIARSFYYPINNTLDKFNEATTRIAEGNFDLVIEDLPHNELGLVGKALNSMSSKLNHLFQEANRRINFEMVLAQVTGIIINSGTGDTNDAIRKIQALWGEYLGASRSVVYLYNESDDLFYCRYEWYKDSTISRVNQEKLTYPSNVFPVFIPIIKMDRIVCLSINDGEKTIREFMPDIADLISHPDMQCKETGLYKYIQKYEMCLMIGLPIFEGTSFKGLVSYGFTEHPADLEYWKGSNLRTLKHVFSSSLMYIRERQQLVHEHERLLTTLYSIGDAVIATDASGRISLMNKIAEAMTGWKQEEAVNKKLSEVFQIHHAETGLPLENPVDKVLTLQKRMELDANAMLTSRNGNEFIVSDSAAPIFDNTGQMIGVVLVFRDDTEKYQLAREKSKLQRLEAVSLLAAGIAHDFNNLLTAILGNLNLAKELVPHYSEAAKIISAAEASTEKGKDITNQLLVYARGGVPERKTSSVTKLIRETTNFLLKGSRIECKMDIDPELHKVHMAEGIFNQILTNIIINAKQAMQNDGTISMQARNISVTKKLNLPIKDGDYVLLSIIDDGEGIPAEDLARIFDPYYSTKNTGSGLGLTSVLSLLQKHEGFVTVNSKVNEGTRVNLYFPASDEEIELSSMVEDLKALRVLGYENDETLQKMVNKALEAIGIDTVITGSLVDMMEWFKISQGGDSGFDAVFIDVNDPNLDFLKTIVTELLNINAKLKIVLACDYVEKGTLNYLKRIGIYEVVVKPFHIESLRSIFGKIASTKVKTH